MKSARELELISRQIDACNELIDFLVDCDLPEKGRMLDDLNRLRGRFEESEDEE